MMTPDTKGRRTVAALMALVVGAAAGLLILQATTASGAQPSDQQSAGPGAPDEHGVPLPESEAEPGGDDVVIDESSRRVLIEEGGLQLEISESNIGPCLHIVDGNGSGGGCGGFNLDDPEDVWLVGSLGELTFAAGVVSPSVEMVEIELTDGSSARASVQRGAWLVLLDSSHHDLAVSSMSWLDSNGAVVGQWDK